MTWPLMTALAIQSPRWSAATVVVSLVLPGPTLKVRWKSGALTFVAVADDLIGIDDVGEDGVEIERGDEVLYTPE